MKRPLITLLLALGLIPAARAQEVTYALPRTTLTVKVEYQQENFQAGPYAAYAKKFLNLDVRDKDAVSFAVTALELIPGVEADPSAFFTTEADNAALLALSAQGLIALQSRSEAERLQWRFQPLTEELFLGSIASPNKQETRISYKSVQTEDGVIQVPVEHKVKQAKSLEDKAAEAAEMVLKFRKDRQDIISGETDASYSGEAMRAALQELNKLEEEYLALFCGRSVVRTNVAYFDVIPDPAQRVHRYLAFRLTETGPMAEAAKGVPYYVELEPQNMEFPEDASRSKGKATNIRYRIPLVCRVLVTRDGERLLDARVPVYQLGMEAYYSQYK